MDEGHCGLPTGELRALAAALLEIPPELVDEALALELAEGAVAADTVEGRACVFLAGLYREGIAERLLRLQEGPCPGRRSTRTRRSRGPSARPGSPWRKASGRRCSWRCARRCW